MGLEIPTTSQNHSAKNKIDISGGRGELIKKELVEGRISRCVYGHMLWHFNGRKNMKDLLENGFEMIKENGMTRLKSTCE